MSSFPISHSLEELEALSPRATAVTLGVFDGVHRGHRAIIEALMRSRRKGVESVYVITFDPHPVEVTHTREAPPILSTIEERLDLFSQFPLDGVHVVEFDAVVAQLDYRDFIQKYLLDALDMKRLVLGYDCHFGKNRGGTPESVQAAGREIGFDVEIVPPLQLDGQIISSTHIRNTLLAGDLALANRLLGHPYTVAGRVKKGEGRGKSLGFPTANLSIENSAKLRPPRGVYAVRVKLDEELYEGMMNVGTAPTIKAGEEELEVHIFDFAGDVYGRRIVVCCEAFLRHERRFPSASELAAQLERDRETAKNTLRHTGKKTDW